MATAQPSRDWRADKHSPGSRGPRCESQLCHVFNNCFLSCKRKITIGEAYGSSSVVGAGQRVDVSTWAMGGGGGGLTGVSTWPRACSS